MAGKTYAGHANLSESDVDSEINEEWLIGAFDTFAKTHDLHLRDEIACRNSWLAERSARHFRNRGEPFEDLIQVAHIGLLKAIDRFDPALGVCFGAYATPTILGEIRRHFRDCTWSLHVPRPTKDIRAVVNSAKNELEAALGRPAHVVEIANRLEMSEDAISRAITANGARQTYSLDRPEADRMEVSNSPFDGVLDRVMIAELLHQLSPRQREIIYLHFFEDRSQVQVAAQLGISQVHVGRLLAASLKHLRDQLGNNLKSNDV